MKKITKYLVVVLAALAFAGCKDKMRELNTNPDIMGESDPRYIFSAAVQNLDNQSVWDQYTGGGVMMQYFVGYEGAVDGTYCNPATDTYVSPSSVTTMYQAYYGVGKQMILLREYIASNISKADQPKYDDLSSISSIIELFYIFRAFENFGSAVYSQAFKSQEGILKPEYDIFTPELYLEIDTKLAAAIAKLDEKMYPEAIDMGIYDPVYGYVTAINGAPTLLADKLLQRDRWRRFGNAIRLDMAWRMSQVPALAAHLDVVLAATLESGLFRNADDSAITHLQGPEASPGGIYSGTNGSSQVSFYYSVSDNFITYLKNLKDPRLPLLARVNSLYPTNPDLMIIKEYFPDSLKMAGFKYGDDSGVMSWGGVLDIDADPMLAFQGQSPNPVTYATTGPGVFWGKRVYTFTFYHPEWNHSNDKAASEANAKLKSWTKASTYAGGEPMLFENAMITYNFDMASRPQGRYFVSCGGHDFEQADLSTYGNGKDGPTENKDKIFYTSSIYTYVEQCFLLSYLTLDGKATGETADVWYDRGVRAAMVELQNDALRYQIQAAQNPAAERKVVGVNEDGLYAVTADMIDNYVTVENPLSAFADKKEAIVGQMWIYSYKNTKRMWNWIRMTGYPKMQVITTLSQRPTAKVPYFVTPFTRDNSSKAALVMPRRGNMNDVVPDNANRDNFDIAKAKLLKLEGYGSNERYTTGRIFWDRQGL